MVIQIAECKVLKIPIIYLRLCYYIYYLNVLYIHNTQVIWIQSTDFICRWEQIKQYTVVIFLLVLEDLIELNNWIMIYYLEITKTEKNHDSFNLLIFLIFWNNL